MTFKMSGEIEFDVANTIQEEIVKSSLLEALSAWMRVCRDTFGEDVKIHIPDEFKHIPKL